MKLPGASGGWDAQVAARSVLHREHDIRTLTFCDNDQ